MSVRDCQVEWGISCSDYPYTKQSLCDYPYIGAIAVPVSEAKAKSSHNTNYKLRYGNGCRWWEASKDAKPEETGCFTCPYPDCELYARGRPKKR